MQKKLMLAVVLLLVATLAFASVAWAQDEDEPVLARLEVRNRTGQPVSIVLVLTDPETEGDVFASALTVSAGTTRTFTVPKGQYDHTTFACGESANGTLDLTRQTRLIFVQCNKEVTHQGEPTMEKVNLDQETPSGINFGYKID
jgi:hypothetical protein